MEISDLQELVADYRSADLLWRDAYLALLMLLPKHEVVEIMDALPAELADRFGVALADDFGHETPASEMIWINSPVKDTERELVVKRARVWLDRKRRP